MREIHHEPDHFKSWPAEHCSECKEPTRFWLTPHIALCPNCALNDEKLSPDEQIEAFKRIRGNKSLSKDKQLAAFRVICKECLDYFSSQVRILPNFKRGKELEFKLLEALTNE